MPKPPPSPQGFHRDPKVSSKGSYHDPQANGFGLDLASLLQKAGISASSPSDTPPSKGDTPPADTSPTSSLPSLPLQHSKILRLRRETKGRAGKTVTLLSGVSLPPDALASWLRSLQKALGCGASLEGDSIVLQGDQIQRLESWLPSQGATSIRRS